MKNFKLGLLTTTICLAIALPTLFFGLEVSYIKAYESPNVPNVSEIIYEFDTQEVKNVYNLNLVTVVINGLPKRVLTNRIDIYRFLEDLGVVVNNNKRIISTTDEIQDGTVIRVITVGTVVEEEQIEIPYRTEEVATKEIPYGKSLTVQEGVLGIRTKEVKRTYEDGILVSEEILSERITREPENAIVKIGVLKYSPEDLDVRYGYNCAHWYSVVDQGDYTEQEKQWLKFVMECESGCNAENNRNSTYKGLFQWNPRYWDIFFPDENIFDGYAQIKNTMWKVRDGAKLNVYWPNCHRKYVAKYGEFVR
jgi:hypothetical protein